MARIDHVNIVVSNLERSARFYEELLDLRPGFSAVLQGEWIETLTGLAGAHARCLFMEPGPPSAAEPAAAGPAAAPIRLELLEYRTPRGEAIPAGSLPHTPGLRHLAFLVDDLDALRERLRAAGVEPVGGPCEVPFRVGRLGTKRLLYFLDPDGVLLEAAAYARPE